MYVLVSKERAKSQTPTFWGISMVVYSTVDTSAPRGRTLDGEDFRPLGIKVPRGVCPEEGGAAHGPLHPAVFIFKIVWFLFGFRGCSKGFVLGLFMASSGDSLIWIL